LHRAILIWGVLGLALLAPVMAAAFSPLLAWRQPIYILSGFAGILAMALMVVQPLAAARLLPGMSGQGSRRLHRGIGGALIVLIVVHVAGLWITSPPDVLDALLFRSPTPFSAWGVIAMWAIFLAALLAILRKRVRLAWRNWRRLHMYLAATTVVCTILHAALIEGTMESVTKVGLSALLLGATAFVMWNIVVARKPRVDL
jgi:predicted ferric reductase